MFVVKYLVVTFIVYIVLTRIIPACIGAYYGGKLWKKYSGLSTIVPKEMVDKWFQTDLELHLLNNPYIRFITRF